MLRFYIKPEWKQCCGVLTDVGWSDDRKAYYQGHHCHFFKCSKIKTYTHTSHIHIHIYEVSVFSTNKYSAIRQYVIYTFLSFTLARTYILSPFFLFSEVAHPLSKVCVLPKAECISIYFHSIWGGSSSRVMFFSHASCLSPSSFSPSAHLAALLIPSIPSRALHTAYLLAWGVLGRGDTNNYWPNSRERNTFLCVHVCWKMHTSAEHTNTWDVDLRVSVRL